MSSTALFACSKCFTKHPFEELSSGQQLCKDCRGAFPIVKCTYCRSEFQQTNKVTSTICSKCEHNMKQFGKPGACEYCNIIAAFIGNKCQRCTNSERKYGPPVTCEQCKQKCAFDRKDDDKKSPSQDPSFPSSPSSIKVDGKLLCWLCTLSYKRALAKTKQSESERRGHLKISSRTSSKSRDRLRHKRPRVDMNKVDISRHESNDSGSLPPANKLARSGNHRPPGDVLDPNSSDHVVAMTQLKEQMASMQKQLVQKDLLLLTKDKQITELKANHFTIETELRNKMMNSVKEHDKKVETMSLKIKSLQKEVATLSKTQRKNLSKENKAKLLVNNENNNDTGNSGSGTDSPLP